MENTTSNLATTPSQPIKRDWFGYIFTTTFGIFATILVAWYQLYSSQNEVATAERERAKAVKQAAVAIIEQHALNGKRLEVERLTRLIDQRRRDESISLPITAAETVELAEFNIASSHHLSIERKEDIKPFFDAFYNDLKSRSFIPSTKGGHSAELLNEIARKIQEGKSAEALAALKRLDEVHSVEVSEIRKDSKIGIFEVVGQILSDPWKVAGLCIGSLLYLRLSLMFLRRKKKSVTQSIRNFY